tara:strand:- start:858 stop:1052 length:195 start_codon:yes stop_codon:yes gene_type:complete
LASATLVQLTSGTTARAKEAVNRNNLGVLAGTANNQVVVIDDYVVNYWADVLAVSGTRQVDISA